MNHPQQIRLKHEYVPEEFVILINRTFVQGPPFAKCFIVNLSLKVHLYFKLHTKCKLVSKLQPIHLSLNIFVAFNQYDSKKPQADNGKKKQVCQNSYFFRI